VLYVETYQKAHTTTHRCSVILPWRCHRHRYLACAPRPPVTVPSPVAQNTPRPYAIQFCFSTLPPGCSILVLPLVLRSLPVPVALRFFPVGSDLTKVWFLRFDVFALPGCLYLFSVAVYRTCPSRCAICDTRAFHFTLRIGSVISGLDSPWRLWVRGFWLPDSVPTPCGYAVARTVARLCGPISVTAHSSATVGLHYTLRLVTRASSDIAISRSVYGWLTVHIALPVGCCCCCFVIRYGMFG